LPSYSVCFARHRLRVDTNVTWVRGWFNASGCMETGALKAEADIILRINEGYGLPFESFDVRIEKTKQGTCFTRADYRLLISVDYREAQLEVYDELSLKHAMLHLYSLYIVHKEWGLLLHSSCVVEQGKAYVFGGPSGVGKSTVARLSAPRKLLSDEASLLHLSPEGQIVIYDSPFRSEIPRIESVEPCSLEAIYLLNQSDAVAARTVASGQAFEKLLRNVIYWAHDPAETAKVVRMVANLACRGATFDLFFQRNDSFWKVISS